MRKQTLSNRSESTSCSCTVMQRRYQRNAVTRLSLSLGCRFHGKVCICSSSTSSATCRLDNLHYDLPNLSATVEKISGRLRSAFNMCRLQRTSTTVFVYKVLRQTAPSYLVDMCQPASTSFTRRSATHDDLVHDTENKLFLHLLR